jgi:hypothetical protein
VTIPPHDAVDRWTGLSARAVADEIERLGWSDGLPVAELTHDDVAEALRHLDRTFDDVVALVPPSGAALTAGLLTAWTLLAGAAPAHVRHVEACVRSLARPELAALGVLTTTGNAALMVVVNGPSARRLGFHGGANCLGPGCRANVCVGRALSLVVRNVGGAREGRADMATTGQPAKLGFCFAENEAMSPWVPLSSDRGLDGDAVTVLGVSGIAEVHDAACVDPVDRLDLLAGAMRARTVRPGIGSPLPEAVVLLSPEWAHGLHAAGFDKRAVSRYVLEHADGSDGPAHSQVHVVVAGGAGVKQTYVAGWPGSRAVTVAVAAH